MEQSDEDLERVSPDADLALYLPTSVKSIESMSDTDVSRENSPSLDLTKKPRPRPRPRKAKRPRVVRSSSVSQSYPSANFTTALPPPDSSRSYIGENRMLDNFSPTEDPCSSSSLTQIANSMLSIPTTEQPFSSVLNPQPSPNSFEQGWQEQKLTLRDRASYLLNNPRMSDIKFVVGECKAEVYAHKTILSMGSPVFEAQFFGSLANSNETVIEVPDIEPDTFLLFLKYLYTDELDDPVVDMQVLYLIRPAKKYLVPHLVDLCSDILMKELHSENVFEVLSYAGFFELKSLEGACLRYIDRECAAIVHSEHFVLLNMDTMIELLKRDGLKIKEEHLFRAVVRWAKNECNRRSLEVTDDNIRYVLGPALKLIRFPTMSSEAFASEVASHNVLTAEEARTIFVYLCSPHTCKDMCSTLGFPTAPRMFYPQQFVVNRFSGIPVSHVLNYRSGEIYNYRVNFQTDRQIYLKGINIFTLIYDGTQNNLRRFNGAVYCYMDKRPDLSVEKGRQVFVRNGAVVPEDVNSSREKYFPVIFDQDIRIEAKQSYTVGAVVSVASTTYHHQGLSTFLGCSPLRTVLVPCVDGLQVKFTFSNSSKEYDVGKFTRGQIPELIFSL